MDAYELLEAKLKMIVDQVGPLGGEAAVVTRQIRDAIEQVQYHYEEKDSRTGEPVTEITVRVGMQTREIVNLSEDVYAYRVSDRATIGMFRSLDDAINAAEVNMMYGGQWS